MGQAEAQTLTVVPELLGLTANTAHDMALDAQLLAVDQDPSHSPTVAGVVAAQDPLAGREVPAGEHVRIWVRRDSAGGDDDPGGPGGPPVPSSPKPLEPTGAKT
ncbi:MAG TPA: PASTA domain-containing protein [Pseudonocardia sp.]|jgi:beta-lactam-binding protein with PASTA domain|nr:PASTA domain-containing protein [Pseudonocardia sp.]